MSEVINVLLADDNTELAEILYEYLNDQKDINVVGTACDGIETLKLIDVLKPDVVVLDIIMPNLDGIGVLEKVRTLKPMNPPLFIILSAIGQDIFTQKAIYLGADYYLVKPFAADVLANRIRQVYRERMKPDISIASVEIRTSALQVTKNDRLNNIELEVTNLLRNSGVSPHLAGYQYLREAIIEVVKVPKASIAVTKVLYPLVAHKYNTTSQKIERSIRSAIDNAWLKGIGLQFFSKNNDRKPTNSEFIATVADRVRLTLGKGR